MAVKAENTLGELGKNIRYFLGKDRDRDIVVGRTSSYGLQIQYDRPNSAYHLRFSKGNEYMKDTNAVCIHTTLQVDQNDECVGLVTTSDSYNGRQYNKQLAVWVKKDTNTVLYAEYGEDEDNPLIGKVVRLVHQIGPDNYREAREIPEDQWAAVLKQGNLPEKIDIAASIRRLVLGKEADTRFPLTDKSIETIPLIPRP